MKLEDIVQRLVGLDGRVLEDRIYSLVWEEIEQGILDPAAQARALEESEGDEARQRAAYIKHRVRRVKDEFELLNRSIARIEKHAMAQKPLPKTLPKTVSKSKKTTCDYCGVKFGFLGQSGSSGL